MNAVSYRKIIIPPPPSSMVPRPQGGGHSRCVIHPVQFHGFRYNDKYQSWIGYKEEAASGNAAFKVNRYYHTPWMQSEELPLKIDGLSTDAVYENFVRQIAGEALSIGEAGESLKETINREEEIQSLKRQIEKLQMKIRREKQFNLQIKMNGELKKLKARLVGLQ